MKPRKARWPWDWLSTLTRNEIGISNYVVGNN